MPESPSKPNGERGGNGGADRTADGLSRLDKLLEHRSRLGACVLLARSDAMTFTTLRDLLRETDGNLGAHLRKLEDAGYVHVDKRFEDRKPVSWYTLAPKGDRALKTHLSAMESVLKSAAH